MKDLDKALESILIELVLKSRDTEGEIDLTSYGKEIKELFNGTPSK